MGNSDFSWWSTQSPIILWETQMTIIAIYGVTWNEEHNMLSLRAEVIVFLLQISRKPQKGNMIWALVVHFLNFYQLQSLRNHWRKDKSTESWLRESAYKRGNKQCKIRKRLWKRQGILIIKEIIWSCLWRTLKINKDTSGELGDLEPLPFPLRVTFFSTWIWESKWITSKISFVLKIF